MSSKALASSVAALASSAAKDGRKIGRAEGWKRPPSGSSEVPRIRRWERTRDAAEAMTSAGGLTLKIGDGRARPLAYRDATTFTLETGRYSFVMDYGRVG